MNAGRTAGHSRRDNARYVSSRSIYGAVDSGFTTLQGGWDVVAVPEYAPGTCGTCRHWNPPEQYQRGYGACERIPHDEETTLAYASDAEGYSAVLRTRQDFGCVLQEG